MATPVTALTTSVRQTAASIVAILAPDYGEIAQELFQVSDAKALCDAAAIADRALKLGHDNASVRQLRTARNAERCEREEAAEPDVNYSGVPPCWHSDGQPPPQSEWCEPCRRRQAFHGRMVAAKRQRAAGLRWLESMVSRHPACEKGGE